MHTFTPYCACVSLYVQRFFLPVQYFLICLSLKFHKDPSYSCGDICKIIMILVSSLIFNVMHILKIN